MKIENFDRQNLNALRSEMEALLAKYGNKTGIEFKVGNISFDEAEANIKVSAKVKGAKTMADSLLDMVCKNLKITNRTNAKGETLVAYNSRSTKYPFVYETVRGTKYKCTQTEAIKMFA